MQKRKQILISGLRKESNINCDRSVYLNKKQTIYAISDVGKVKKQQEDALLIATHFKNENLQIMAVCDGMGGMNNASLISDEILSEISIWFQKIQQDDTGELVLQMTEFINQLQYKFYHKYKEETGSTLAMVMINKKHVLIASVGDTRVYRYYNTNLIQMTVDDSKAWTLLKDKSLNLTKDDLRFHDYGDILTKYIGKGKRNTDQAVIKQEDIKIIPKNEVGEFLILCSDGLTDMIGDSTIARIIKDKKELGVKEIGDSLVAYALENKAIRIGKKLEKMCDMWSPGKDNITLIIRQF